VWGTKGAAVPLALFVLWFWSHWGSTDVSTENGWQKRGLLCQVLKLVTNLICSTLASPCHRDCENAFLVCRGDSMNDHKEAESERNA